MRITCNICNRTFTVDSDDEWVECPYQTAWERDNPHAAANRNFASHMNALVRMANG